MAREMFYHTKKVLESVSFDPTLFYKELKKAIDALLPYEIEELKKWLSNYTKEKPELAQYKVILN